MDAEPLFASERASYGFGNRAEAKLDRRSAAGASTSIAPGSIAVSLLIHGNSGMTSRARPITPRRDRDSHLVMQTI
jgi:hypothetical protein